MTELLNWIIFFSDKTKVTNYSNSIPLFLLRRESGDMDYRATLAFQKIVRLFLSSFRYLWGIMTRYFGALIQKIIKIIRYIGSNSFFMLFCEETNIHGFNHVANKNHLPFERCSINHHIFNRLKVTKKLLISESVGCH